MDGIVAERARLGAALVYLKQTYRLLGEAVVECWVENPYWQASYGEEYFQHEPLIHPQSNQPDELPQAPGSVGKE